MGLDNLVFVLAEQSKNWCQDSAAQQLQTVVSSIVNLIKIVIPIALVILGMLDLGKAVMSQKEDEIKKGQAVFIKRLIAAVIVFLVFFVVQVVFNFIVPDNADKNSMMRCVKAFINGPATWNEAGSTGGNGGSNTNDTSGARPID